MVVHSRRGGAAIRFGALRWTEAHHKPVASVKRY
jgi:hypothetical protein